MCPIIGTTGNRLSSLVITSYKQKFYDSVRVIRYTVNRDGLELVSCPARRSSPSFVSARGRSDGLGTRLVWNYGRIQLVIISYKEKSYYSLCG